MCFNLINGQKWLSICILKRNQHVKNVFSIFLLSNFPTTMRPLMDPLIFDGAMESIQCAHHASGNLLVAIQVKANQAWVVI